MFKQGSGFSRGRRCRPSLARGLLCFVLCCPCILLDAVAAPSEGELRAAVIVAIMRFTSWESVPSEKTVLDVCLVGKPMSAAVLLAISGEQKVATRTLSVRSAQGDIAQCQALVIGEDIDDDEYEQLIVHTDGQSVLTVCDGCRRGLGEDAIIQLRLRQQRVSFEVNLARARSNNVALDAQLLELAALVRR